MSLTVTTEVTIVCDNCPDNARLTMQVDMVETNKGRHVVPDHATRPALEAAGWGYQNCPACTKRKAGPTF